MNGNIAMRSASVWICPTSPCAPGSTSGVTAAPTRIDTATTTTRNVVPHRGCNVVCARTFSTVSGRAFS